MAAALPRAPSVRRERGAGAGRPRGQGPLLYPLEGARVIQSLQRWYRDWGCGFKPT